MSYAADVAVSEGARQTDHKNAVSVADHTNADIAHALRMITAARTYHVRNQSMSYLIRLGGQAPAGSWTADDT
jgi:hypothetical protein